MKPSILDKLRFVESDAVPKNGAKIEALSTSIKITHSCGCLLVQHFACGKPDMSRAENLAKYDRLLAERANFVELCPIHIKDFENHFSMSQIPHKLHQSWQRGGCDRFLDKALVRILIAEDGLINNKRAFGFKLKLTFTWYVELKKSDEEYMPYTYDLTAACMDNSQHFDSRYKTVQDALLHCLNDFNENINIRDRYHCINDFLSKS